MKKLTLVVAGTAVTIQLDGAIAALQAPLRDVFRGFLTAGGAAMAARLTVSYDHRATFPRFDVRPALLSPGKEQPPLLHRIAELHPSDAPHLIGYLNGVLAYTAGSREARLHLFRSDGENVLVGSLLKLLFLYLAIVLAEQDKLMIHGAGIRIQSEGALFLGGSGAGKSTVAGYANREDVLSDDAPVIARDGRLFTIHASPFSQVDLFGRKAADHHRKEAPLARLVFLRQANRLELAPRDKRAVLGGLVRDHIHGFDVMNRELRVRAFAFCCGLCDAVPGFDLFFEKDDRFLSLFGRRVSEDDAK